MISRARFSMIRLGTWAIRHLKPRFQQHPWKESGEVVFIKRGDNIMADRQTAGLRDNRKRMWASGVSREMEPRWGGEHVGPRRGKGSSPNEGHGRTAVSVAVQRQEEIWMLIKQAKPSYSLFRPSTDSMRPT